MRIITSHGDPNGDITVAQIATMTLQVILLIALAGTCAASDGACSNP